MQENMRNLGGMRNSYLICRSLIARIQRILNVESWTQNSSEMVDLLVKPSNLLSIFTHQLLKKIHNFYKM